MSQELRNLDLQLPMEHLRYQENGDPVDYRQVIVQIQDGNSKSFIRRIRLPAELVYPLPAGSVK